MKKILWSCFFFCIIFSVSAQISLEHSFNYSATVTKINSNTYKYFLMDVPAEECRIYNLDFSLYKTISLPVPDGEWLYDIRFVSEYLFNDNSETELLYTYYKWVSTNSSTGDGYYVYTSRIISENGTLLADIPGALYSYINKTDENEYSLFLYVYDFSQDPYSIKTNIYSLPGTPETAEALIKESAQFIAFPNPASSSVRIEYSLPGGVQNAELVILNSSGKEIKSIIADGFRNSVLWETENVPSGIYFYFLKGENLRTEAKKIIIP